MDVIFLAVLNRAYAASVLILVVFLLRLLFRRVGHIPQWCFPLFWMMVAVRLVLPFSIPSPLCLIPSAKPLTVDAVRYAAHPTVDTGISFVDQAVDPMLERAFAPAAGESVNPLYVYTVAAAWIWIAGICVMLLYFAVSTIRMRRRLREAIPYRDNIWLCDRVRTPFLFGIVHPRIYLPSSMENAPPEETDAVIRHENAHLSRLDHITKSAGFLLLAVYWFCPTVWLAYLLFCRDLEYACDARVIAGLDTEGRRSYSNALLHCAAREGLHGCPIAFGENGVKGRIRAVLSYKKPPFWCILAVIMTAVVLAVCFLTAPGEDEGPTPAEAADSTQTGPAIRFAFDENDTRQTLYSTASGAAIVVQQRDEPAPAAEEIFYEDADAVYSFPQTIGDRITVSLPDGTSVTVAEALRQGYITLDDLIRAGIAYNRAEKSQAQKYIDKLIASIRCAYGQITFTLPESDMDWELHIAGAYVVTNGRLTASGTSTSAENTEFVQSRHFLEDEKWKSGRSYTFDYGKVDGSSAWYRSLDMTVVCGNTETTIPLTVLFPEELTGGANHTMPKMHVTPIY